MLNGKRIRLRIARRSDIPVIVPWTLDEELCTFLYGSPLVSEDEKKHFLSGLDRKGKFFKNMYLVIETIDLTPIGFVHLHSIDWRNGNLINDIAIGDKENRGKKLGAEALFLLAKFIFDDLNMHKLSGHVYAFNERSIALNKHAETFGIKLEGTLRKHAFKGGIYHDTFIFSWLRRDFEKNKNNIESAL